MQAVLLSDNGEPIKILFCVFSDFSIDCLEEKLSHILTTEINQCALFNSLKFLC